MKRINLWDLISLENTAYILPINKLITLSLKKQKQKTYPFTLTIWFLTIALKLFFLPFAFLILFDLCYPNLFSSKSWRTRIHYFFFYF